jgi:large repetitive protein
MTGGTGAVDTISDTFVWRLNDNGTIAAPTVDTITFFGAGTVASGGDALDIRDLLPTNGLTTGAALDNYLYIRLNGTTTEVYISTTGAFGDNPANVGATLPAAVSNNDVQQIFLTNVNLTTGFTGLSQASLIDDLLLKGKLITD